MCGIVGAYHFKEQASPISIDPAIKQLGHRGPDGHGVHRTNKCVLGHTRLSILDPTKAGTQPFVDPSGRYSLTFNGEIYNHLELRKQLAGIEFRSGTDTETLLHLLITQGAACLNDLNGFFAFAFHDKEKEELLIARDRMGIKPLFYALNEERILFSSELRALMAMGVHKEIDPTSLYQYFRFHYIAAPHSIFNDVKKLMPGHLISIKAGKTSMEHWYMVEPASSGTGIRQLMEASVVDRLLADVPLGTFLSGGLDSSIVSALAAQRHPGLNTFSIGFTDDPYYDESPVAERVAKHIGSTHHAFRLSTQDLEDHYLEFLASTDEPFADSSALPMYILSKRTRDHVKVALSGDGADELFAGYRKHMAWYRMDDPGMKERLAHVAAPLWRSMPRSRTSRSADLFRKLDRFATTARLLAPERYWELASFEQDQVVRQLLQGSVTTVDLQARKERILHRLRTGTSLENALRIDQELVLANDMLVKVDRMSMMHGLEVRVPFLDHRMVEFAAGLPIQQKIDRRGGKQILRREFADLIPLEVIERSKKGFEVPLKRLFRGKLNAVLADLIQKGSSKHLNTSTLVQMAAQLGSDRNTTREATIHATLVFRSWWERWMT